MTEDHVGGHPEPAGEPAAPGGAPAGEPAGESAGESAGASTLPPLREVAELRKPSTLGGVIYLGVLAAALVGVGLAATGAWRTGVSWLAVSLLAGAAARLVLRDDNAGMLRVRRKALDAVILISAGVVLLVLVATIPDQPS